MSLKIKDTLWLNGLERETGKRLPDDLLPGEELLVNFSDGTLNLVEIPSLDFPYDVIHSSLHHIYDQEQLPPWQSQDNNFHYWLENAHEDSPPVQFKKSNKSRTKKDLVMEPNKKRRTN